MQETLEPIVPISHYKTVQVVVQVSMAANAAATLGAQYSNGSLATGSDCA